MLQGCKQTSNGCQVAMSDKYLYKDTEVFFGFFQLNQFTTFCWPRTTLAESCLRHQAVGLEPEPGSWKQASYNTAVPDLIHRYNIIIDFFFYEY